MILGLPGQAQIRPGGFAFGGQGANPLPVFHPVQPSPTQQPPLSAQPPITSPFLTAMEQSAQQPMQQSSPLPNSAPLQQALLARTLANPDQISPARDFFNQHINPLFSPGPLSPSAQTAARSDGLDNIGGGGREGSGNPGGGQPGSAGEGWGKTAADALMGLVGGAIAPGFGTAIMGARALTEPGFSPFSFGPAPATNPTGTMIENMGMNPGAYGLDNAAVSRTGQMTQDESPQQQAAQQRALDAANTQAGGTSSDVSHDPGSFGADTSMGQGASADPGSGSGGRGASDSGGGGWGYMAHGGIVRGPGGIDSKPTMLTPGEGVLTPGAVRALSPQRLMLLNAIAGMSNVAR